MKYGARSEKEVIDRRFCILEDSFYNRKNHYILSSFCRARVVKLVYTLVLGTSAARRKGSSPFSRTARSGQFKVQAAPHKDTSIHCRERPEFEADSAQKPESRRVGTRILIPTCRDNAAIEARNTYIEVSYAKVAELVDALDSKSSGRKPVWVRVPPLVPSTDADGEPRKKRSEIGVGIGFRNRTETGWQLAKCRGSPRGCPNWRWLSIPIPTPTANPGRSDRKSESLSGSGSNGNHLAVGKV